MPETTPHENTQSSAVSFRRFLQELKGENDLVVIDEEVDPHLEIAAISRKVYETRDKAPLFNNVKGLNPNGLFRVFGAPVGMSRQPGKEFIRIAKSLGLPSTATGRDIIQKLREAKHLRPIPPREVASGPVKEFKLIGDEIDLTALPIPLLHTGDGGKYFQTFGMYIVETPDGSWVNWSITRSMLHGKRSLVGLVIPRQDIGVIREMWKEKDQDVPFALCFGVPPAAILVSGMPLPKGVDESGYIGALVGSPVEVTKCETNNLRVPANAEIVLEGVISRTETAPEGPMTEYPAHAFSGGSRQNPVFKINAITYRKNPILPICVTGRAPEESETVWALTIAAEVLSICQDAGLPIKMAWSPFESHCMWYVLQVDRRQLRTLNTNMEDFSNRVGHTVFGSKPGFYIPVIYLVGDDIDPTNLNDVIWADATRCQPKVNEFFFDQYQNIALIPYVGHGVKASQNHYKVVRCCFFPSEFSSEDLVWREASYRGDYPQQIQDKVDGKWTAYGF